MNAQQPTSGSLGVGPLVAIGIGGMVGGGIFSVLGLTVQVAGAGAYLSFVVGGVVAALTGLSYARLSVAVRSRGGTATFLDRAFPVRVAGPLNLLLWLSYFVMLGLYALAFGAYLAALLGLDPNGSAREILGSLVVVAFAVLNLAGAQMVGRAESALVYFKLAVLVVFCAGGLAFVDGARVSPSAFPSLASIVYAGTLIFLAYEGFELIANASEDARDPERSLPRAYLIAIGAVICLYVIVAFVAVGNLPPARIAAERDYVLAAAARPFLGSAGFKLISVAAVVSTASAINATLYGAAKFTYLMARHAELPERLGKPIWDRPIGGLLATMLGTLVIVNTVNIEGVSLMGSAGFLIVFAAVNLAARRLLANTRLTAAAALAGLLACVVCLGALLTYAATHIPGQLGVLGGLIGAAILAEAILRQRRASSEAKHQPTLAR
jgi:amino acid transporter